MKLKILFLLPLVFLSAFFISYCQDVPDAKAEQSVYMRVVDSETPFYLDKSEGEPFFYLPCSYFVKILEEDENFYHVECFGELAPAIDGFVPKDMLISIDYDVQSPYMQATVTTLSSCMLYADNDAKEGVYHIFPDRSLTLYGSYFEQGEENLYLVCYNDKLGFVKESYLKPFTMPTHPIPLPQNNSNQVVETSKKQSPSSNFDGLKTAIIICLSLAGVIALCLVVKRKKPSETATTFVDDDF
ncbi:MAG: hypothetical protein IKB98_01170 [Clostridia bacterium]|nr:hypothetical protein [Clostridia bacterium]